MVKVRQEIYPIHLALLTLAHAVANNPERQKIAELEALPAEWDHLNFSYGGKPATLIRVPKPEPLVEGVLEASPNFYLVAYVLECPQSGLEVRHHPGNPQKLVCRCHGSLFWAKDGEHFAGPANQNLQRLCLEVDENLVYAVQP
jgi:Rieske Fe-S protein